MNMAFTVSLISLLELRAMGDEAAAAPPAAAPPLAAGFWAAPPVPAARIDAATKGPLPPAGAAAADATPLAPCAASWFAQRPSTAMGMPVCRPAACSGRSSRRRTRRPSKICMPSTLQREVARIQGLGSAGPAELKGVYVSRGERPWS